MLAKKTAKNQLTLPKVIAKDFENIQYFDVKQEGNTIVLIPVRVTPVSGALNSIREKMARLGLTETDVKAAVTWARKKKKSL